MRRIRRRRSRQCHRAPDVRDRAGRVVPPIIWMDRLRFSGVGTLVLATASVGILQASGVAVDGTAATIAACLAIAVFGLPHGTFDLALLRREGNQGRLAVLGLYLVCAAAMALLWRVHPVAALVVFLVIATVHFAEDWQGTGSAFLSFGIALALIAAPALLHLETLQQIIVALTGSSDAALIGDLLLTLAPIALAVAVAGSIALVQNGEPATAAGVVCSVTALMLLPPALGFALFFCLFHSPRHFSAALNDLGWSRAGQWLPVVVPLTLAALAIVAALFQAGEQTGLALRSVGAIFTALSILTVPHMAVPVIVAAMRRRTLRQSSCR